MKSIAILVVLLAVVGCKSKPIVPAYSLQTLPTVGTIATAGIGERLLIQGDALTVEGIVIPADAIIGEFVVRKGTYPIGAKNDEYRTFVGVEMTKQGRIIKRGQIHLFNKDNGSKTLCIGRRTCADVDYAIGKSTTYSPSSMQQTLLYSGKIGNKITLSYREFKNELARSAFSNDVAYDLTESKVLGYKGARLEVINATNTEITYKVIAGFN
jgi:hypothetical protein